MLGQAGHNTRPYAQLPPSFMSMDAWITSELNVALMSKQRYDVLGVFKYMFPMGVVQSGTGRRPVDWCRN